MAITCPPGQTISGASGSSGAQVTYPTPATTGGTVPVSVSCAPASGTTFLVGSTTISCTARDAGTQQATCSFNVTLTPRLLQVSKFMAFGDSLTEGENGISVVLRRPAVIIPGTPYPAQLAAMLVHEYPTQSFQVVNKGSSGRFAEKGAEDLPKDLAADRPEALLLLDGYNNLFNECPATGSVTSRCTGAMDVVITALTKDITNARSSGVRYVFVSTLTPPGPVSGPRDRRINPDAIVMMNGRIASTVPGQGAILVDTYPRFLGHEAEFVSTDGLHLRPAGYEALARSFYDSINIAIPSMPASASR